MNIFLELDSFLECSDSVAKVLAFERVLRSTYHLFVKSEHEDLPYHLFEMLFYRAEMCHFVKQCKLLENLSLSFLAFIFTHLEIPDDLL